MLLIIVQTELGARRPLLAPRRQPPLFARLENVRRGTAGADQGESHRDRVAVVGYGMDQEQFTTA